MSSKSKPAKTPVVSTKRVRRPPPLPSHLSDAEIRSRITLPPVKFLQRGDK